MALRPYSLQFQWKLPPNKPRQTVSMVDRFSCCLVLLEQMSGLRSLPDCFTFLSLLLCLQWLVFIGPTTRKYYLILIAPGNSQSGNRDNRIYAARCNTCMFAQVMLSQQILTILNICASRVCVCRVCVHIMKKSDALSCQAHLKFDTVWQSRVTRWEQTTD